LHRLVEGEALALVLLDVGLPGEDGFTLARRLREKSSRIGIIMVTSAAETVDRVVGLETGADDYITKPFEPRELLARVRSVLCRGSPEGEALPAREIAAAGSRPSGLAGGASAAGCSATSLAITSTEHAALADRLTHRNLERMRHLVGAGNQLAILAALLEQRLRVRFLKYPAPISVEGICAAIARTGTRDR